MSSSGQDVETSSVDSPQSHYESPYSSPSQQVPQLAFTLTTLNMNTACQPFLRIVEQPQDHFRFRYKSEMVGTHGCLLGKSQGSARNKTHPTVELVNYPGRAIIRCRLAQQYKSGINDEHPHRLLEDEQDREVSYEVPDQGCYKVAFGGMGIIHTAKKDVPGLLYTKYASQLNNQMSQKELRAHCECEAKKINLNIVCLRFSAHDINTNEEICPPVYSEPIHNMKSAATNDLKICRISKTSGRPRGGDDIFIFVEKVNKKNIKIRFFELSSSGEEVWQAFAPFMESDVHHQYAIAFSTPQYKDPYIVSDVTVYFELLRPQDGRTSEPKMFKYRAEEAFKQKNKKRKANSSYSSINSDNSSLKSVGDVPATVMLQTSNGAFNGPNDVDMATTIQSIPLLPIGAHSPHSDALGDALLSNYSATSSPAEQHMYNDNPVLTQCNLQMSTLPVFNSTELKQLLENNSSIPPEEKKKFCEQDWSEYFESFGSMTEETNSMTFIRSMLVPDSGVPKDEAKQGTSKPPTPIYTAKLRGGFKEEDVKPNIVDKTKGQEKPFYKAEDGHEVKRLVVELVDLMRKTPLKKNVVRSKLERLVEKRLSNGDTFLHMSLNSNRPSFEYIVKMAHSLNMTHLLNLQNNALQTILHLAIVAEAPSVGFLVAKGCDPMIEDECGNNAIHYAVMCREEPSCLNSLLDAIEKHSVPHDINAGTNEKQTPLHVAVTYNSVEKTRRLLKHGALTSATDNQGRSPLHIAAKMNYAGVMKELLEFVPSNEIDAVDGRGHTALQILCDGSVQGHTVDMVKMLLQKKADPRAHGDQSAWRLAKNKSAIRAALQDVMTDVMDEDDVKSEPDDDIKSEPEDESGDEYMQAEMCLPDLSLYAGELAPALDASGAWRALAARLSLDSMVTWYQNTASPSRTLLNYLRQSDIDITSKSLAMTLEDLGHGEAAAIIRKYIE